MSTLMIYSISISLLTGVSILVMRLIVRRDYLKRGHLTLSSSILQAIVFFIFGGFPTIYLSGDWPVTNVHLILRVTGISSITIGLAILLQALFRLGILRSLGLRTDDLKITDSYRMSRNPQVLGCFLYVAGFIILWPSWYAMGWGLSLIAVIHLMVLTEEEHLRNKFSQGYEHYCKSVPRYLGYPKKPE
jgi:protein-S-isoprenylcysteine O-methyltransferase Ste14